MRRLCTILFLGVLVIIALTGCDSEPQDIMPPVHVPTELLKEEFYASEAAVGISPQGQIHIAMSICPLETSIEEYCWFTHFYPDSDTQWHRLNYQSPTPGRDMLSPDIVVNDDGIAYMVVRARMLGGTSYDYLIDSFSHGMTRLDSTYGSLDRPKIATNGTDVYVVYPVEDTASFRLRYKQVAGGTASGWVSPAAGDGQYLSGDKYNLAVSRAGYLYVVWNNSLGIYLNSNYGSTGNMSHLRVVESTGGFSTPAIAVSDADSGGNDFVWVVYADFYPDAHINSDDMVLYYCDASDCDGSTEDWFRFSLNSTAEWELRERPRVVGKGSNAYVAFSGRNKYQPAGTAGYEIFVGWHNPITPEEEITTVTDDSIGDFEPVIAIINDYPTVAWRQIPGADGYRDVMLYDSKYGVRKVFESEQGKSNLDIAGNGIHGAGVFLENILRPGIDTVDMYYTYNGFLIHLPFVRR